jgi:pimeloyl-ACP methyl ester carboxylesterase
MDVYLLPGLGADHRLFGHLVLPGHALHYLDRPEVPAGSTMADIARLLASRVNAQVPHALVGVSMGGMEAQELAALTHPRKVVLISSWKGPQEMPAHLKLLRGTHPERLLSKIFMQGSLPVIRWQMGVEKPEEVQLLDSFLQMTSLEQLRVQISACLHWEGPAQPVPGLVHLHGDRDRLMPLSNIQGAQIVKGGGHFMVFSHGAEVSALVAKALEE